MALKSPSVVVYPSTRLEPSESMQGLTRLGEPRDGCNCGCHGGCSGRCDCGHRFPEQRTPVVDLRGARARTNLPPIVTPSHVLGPCLGHRQFTQLMTIVPVPSGNPMKNYLCRESPGDIDGACAWRLADMIYSQPVTLSREQFIREFVAQVAFLWSRRDFGPRDPTPECGGGNFACNIPRPFSLNGCMARKVADHLAPSRWILGQRLNFVNLKDNMDALESFPLDSGMMPRYEQPLDCWACNRWAPHPASTITPSLPWP